MLQRKAPPVATPFPSSTPPRATRRHRVKLLAERDRQGLLLHRRRATDLHIRRVERPGSIANGQTKTCTITNDDIPPTTLIVCKHVINDNGGLATAGYFTMSVSFQRPAAEQGPGIVPGRRATDLHNRQVVGRFPDAVTESGPSGYTATFSAGCSGSIAGQTTTCTVTNDDVQPATPTPTPGDDKDGDGVHDGSDNCPSIANADQADANGNGVGDACDSSDTDHDGFSDRVEYSAGTSRTLKCGIGAWPADINNDRFSDITDISALAGNFGKSVPPAPPRQNIAPDLPDGFVDITDIAKMACFFGKSCTP